MEGHYTELMPIIHQIVTRYYREELGVLPVDNIIPIEVSYDGTYAKRGFRSLHAMGYLVEVYTGYIIDMLVIGKCSVCPREARGMQVFPHGNYIGSSGGMEVQIAKILWGRSRDLGFEYKVMVADGDASTYNAIKDTYGRSSVVKEMCANHVAHVFSPHHHDFSPPGEGSWVEYQKALARGEDPSRAIQEPGIFSTFPLDARKEKCQKGHTQNANESLHSKLWSKVAKHEYHGHKRIVFLGRVTTLDHNFGSEEGSWLRSPGDSESVRVASCNPRPRQQSEEAEDAGPENAAASPPGLPLPRPLPLPCPYSGLARLPGLPPGPAQYRTVSASPVRHGNTALGRGGHHPASPPGLARFPAPSGPRPIPHSFGESCPPWSRPPLYIGSRPRCFLPESVRLGTTFLGRGRHFSSQVPQSFNFPRPARHGTPAPGLARQGGTLDPRPARQPASAPCPAPQHSPRPSTSRNEDPSARPPIPYRVLMGGNSESSEEDAVRESENSEDSFVLCLSCDEGEGDEVTSASTSDIPVAPILPHNPRPGPKIEMRHSLVKGMSPHGRTDPGYNVCLYSRTHTQDLLDVVACKACGGDLTITRHGRGFAQYDSWHCHTCGDLTATKHPKASGCYTPN
ncbi:hypothetical protein C7M84_004156 [Penaeus vannamei]|uniref:Mutator-like transposase domain-containing protein n=1 Tax=Penaeus vannamei TaxID=6689 RepID=A0A3R7QT67_PENVA|nr:hypothetical protein C7M84_004156 [Penaeus vannamei]